MYIQSCLDASDEYTTQIRHVYYFAIISIRITAIFMKVSTIRVVLRQRRAYEHNVLVLICTE